MFSELDQLVATYRGEEVTAQIQDLDRMKESLKSTVQRNENQETVMGSIALMNARIRKLEIRLKATQAGMRSVELEWDRKLERMLGRIGRIKMNVKEKITPPRFLGSFKYFHSGMFRFNLII